MAFIIKTSPTPGGGEGGTKVVCRVRPRTKAEANHKSCVHVRGREVRALSLPSRQRTRVGVKINNTDTIPSPLAGAEGNKIRASDSFLCMKRRSPSLDRLSRCTDSHFTRLRAHVLFPLDR